MRCVSGSWHASATTTDDTPDTAMRDVKATPSSRLSTSSAPRAAKTKMPKSRSRL